MRKPSIGSALTSSVRAEQEAVGLRFADLSSRAARADQALSETGTVVPTQIDHSITTNTALGKQEDSRLNRKIEEELDTPLGTVVRANFSMPVRDYELITQLRERCSRNGVILSRSEILRAGLHALHSLSVPKLLQIAQSLEHLKPGPVKKARRVR